MPYALSCGACGARFSVADDVVRKTLVGRGVVLKCRHCQAPIRVSPSHPPQPTSTPPAPERPKPRPPLRRRPGALPPPEDFDVEPSFVALDPGLLQTGDLGHDVFEALPPAASPSYVDLSELALSVPPTRFSSAPPLDALARPDLKRGEPSPAEDVDFLLGLRGSPGTAAALVGPSLADLAKEVPSEFSDAPKSAPDPSNDTGISPAPGAVRDAATRTASASPRASRSRTAPLLGAAFLLLAAILLFVVRGRPEFAAPTSETASTAAHPEASPTAEAAYTVAAESASAPAAAHASALARATQSRHAAEASAATGGGAKVGPRAPSSPSRTSSSPESSATETRTSAASPAAGSEPSVAASGPFNRAAAAAALTNAAAQAGSCRKDSDPSGTASVTVTFAPSGRVTSATVSGPPFAGTPTGGCIASTLRRAKIPPFDGDPVSVGKTIILQ